MRRCVLYRAVATDRRRILGLGAVLCVLGAGACVLGLAVGTYLSYCQPAIEQHGSQGQNALWAGHQWVGESHTWSEYARLAHQLEENGITDVLFHVGPLTGRGTIDQERFLNASSLVENLKALYPEVRVHAWLGQVEVAGGGPLDLGDDQVRDAIVGTATDFLDMGFDGIHYNIEPVSSGDRDFIDLLRRTKSVAQGRGKVVSVAADELEPLPGSERLVRLFAKQAGFWNRQYYLEVADSVDQIAVMMYDTALPADWLYGTLVAWETRNIVELVGGRVIVFMGVPSYEDQRWSFNPKAENVESGLRGIQKGLEGFEGDELRNFGVAIYAEWTTDEQEWALYRREWLGAN
jgi:hypothetical protein